MIRNHFAAALSVVCLPLLLPACATVPAPPVAYGSIAFYGAVRDNLGRPIAGAQVTIEGVSTRTARRGTFQIAASGRGPYSMVVEHHDFAYYSRVLSQPTEAAVVNLTRASRTVADPKGRISLRDVRRPEDCVAVPSVAGSELPCGAGFAIDIPANALVDAAGTPPSGPVEVKLATFEIHTESMPGPFIIAASDEDETPVAIMTPYGAGSVEIRDVATGRALNLAPGSRARIVIPVHRVAKQLAGPGAPPATIPLLRFNRRTLRWVGIGEMSLADGNYSAEVDHLTDFNADTAVRNWGCIHIMFTGIPPMRITTQPRPVKIVVTPSNVNGGPASGPPISFTTHERGNFINSPGHTVYNLAPGFWYRAAAFDGSTRVTVVGQPSFDTTYLYPQNPQTPRFPTNARVTCQSMYLQWDQTVQSAITIGSSTYDSVVGPVSFNRPIPVIGSLTNRAVIDRLAIGERATAIGVLKDQLWLVVLTPRGQVGLAPRAGADLSEVRPPEPTRVGPPEDLRNE